MAVKKGNFEIVMEKRKKELIGRIEKGEEVISKRELTILNEEDKEKYEKIIERRQGLARYYKNKEKLIKEGVIKRKRGKYLKTYVCDECGKEFKLKYLKKGNEVKFCSNECKRKYLVKLMNEARRNGFHIEKKKKSECKYRIIVTLNGKERKKLGRYFDKKSAINDYDKFIEDNKNIIVSKKYSQRNDWERKYEILLLKLNEEDLEHSKFPNEYGKLIENIVEATHDLDKTEWGNKKREIKKWIILNKQIYNYEEDYHVYGYNSFKRDGNRKNITFILDNLILNNNESKQISIYKNKLLIKDDDHIFDMIIGTNKNVIIDLYNRIEEICTKKKINYITFLGFSDGPLSSDFTEKLIQEKTGWDISKIKKCMSSN